MILNVHSSPLISPSSQALVNLPILSPQSASLRRPASLLRAHSQIRACMRAMADPIEWYPARILQARADGEDGPDPFALIILNQPLRDVSTLKKLWNNCKEYVP